MRFIIKWISLAQIVYQAKKVRLIWTYFNSFLLDMRWMLIGGKISLSERRSLITAHVSYAFTFKLKLSIIWSMIRSASTLMYIIIYNPLTGITLMRVVPSYTRVSTNVSFGLCVFGTHDECGLSLVSKWARKCISYSQDSDLIMRS